MDDSIVDELAAKAKEVNDTVEEIVKSMRASFPTESDPATKRDIANVYASMLYAFEVIHESNIEASITSNKQLKKAATARYVDAVTRFIDSIKAGITSLPGNRSE